MSLPVLFIGNKNYASWSMRPWLALTWGGIAFEERVLPLAMAGYGKSTLPAVRAASPSGRVPVLHTDGLRIYDSLAIAEWAHEEAPQAGLWPADSGARALARSAAAEMHSGFAALRRELPMDIRARTGARALSPDAAGDVARIQELWGDLRERYGAGGPFLFGRRTIADAFYAPVCTRFVTYDVTLDPVCAAYVEALLADPAVTAWGEAAAAEPWTIAAP